METQKTQNISPSIYTKPTEASISEVCASLVLHMILVSPKKGFKNYFVTLKIKSLKLYISSIVRK